MITKENSAAMRARRKHVGSYPGNGAGRKHSAESKALISVSQKAAHARRMTDWDRAVMKAERLDRKRKREASPEYLAKARAFRRKLRVKRGLRLAKQRGPRAI